MSLAQLYTFRKSFEEYTFSAAGLIMKSRKRHHTQPLSRSLHWLPIRSRTKYKISTLCTFTDSSPFYIAQLPFVSTISRHLRSSSNTRTPCIPFIKTKSFCQRAFSFTDPTQWNSLPYDVGHSDSFPAFPTFQAALKIHLLWLAYSPPCLLLLTQRE